MGPDTELVLDFTPNIIIMRMCVCGPCVGGDMRVPQRVCGGQKMTFESWFFSFYCGFQGLNSGLSLVYQVFVRIEPSCWPWKSHRLSKCSRMHTAF